jgi:hypothetical protein
MLLLYERVEECAYLFVILILLFENNSCNAAMSVAHSTSSVIMCAANHKRLIFFIFRPERLLYL